MLLVSWVRFGTGLASTAILCAVGGIPDEGPAGKCVGTGAVYSAAFFQESEMSGGLCGGHVSWVYAHVVPWAAPGHLGGDLPQGGGAVGEGRGGLVQSFRVRCCCRRGLPGAV